MAQAAKKSASIEQDNISKREINKNKKELLNTAVQGHKITTKRGFLDKLFTWCFRGFVYPQIWEDPEVDIPALKFEKDKTRIMTISSGGCNMMNYLSESPAEVNVIDLNPAHVALARLKLCAAKHLPSYHSFYQFFGHADSNVNVTNYYKYIRPHLDEFSKNYWEGWTLFHGRRINYFKKNLYQFGLLGKTLNAVHFICKVYGVDPSEILDAKTMEEQEEIFDRTFRPLFDKKFVRFVCNMPPALYGLGIPPAQFDELKGGEEMADVLRNRLHRLACEFPIQDNYFAWQAFSKEYDHDNRKAVPRYLMEKHYKTIKQYADNANVTHTSITEFLAKRDNESLEGFVFLDALDWMNADQLNELWAEVVRTGAPGARAIFRTAGEESPLTTKLKPEILNKFHYDPSLSDKAVAKDRSSIYGGFHVYTLGGDLGVQKSKNKAKKK